MTVFQPLPETGRRLVLSPQGSLELHREPLPKVAPTEVLLRVLHAGLRPYDLDPRVYAGKTPPGIPVAEVVAIGERVRGWGSMDRVLIAGDSLREEIGVPGLQEYFTVPSRTLQRQLGRRLPTDLSPVDATLVPAAATASRLLRAAGVGDGSRIAVIGLGLVGQIAMVMARHDKADRVLGADTSATLRRKAEWAGATRLVRLGEDPFAAVAAQHTEGTGLDAAIVLLPDAALTHEAVQSLSVGGRLVLGTPLDSSFLLAFPAGQVQDRDLSIIGVNRFQESDVRTAMNTLRNVSAEVLVSRRIGVEEIPGADLEPNYWEHGTHVVIDFGGRG